MDVSKLRSFRSLYDPTSRQNDLRATGPVQATTLRFFWLLYDQTSRNVEEAAVR